MSETAKKDKNIMHFIIYCVIAALGWIIPPVAPITAEGMHLIGVFVAAIYGWTVTTEIWPSLTTLVLIPFTGMADLATTISYAWGNDTILFIILMFVLVAFLEETGSTSYIAAFLLTRNFLKGHPWRLIFMIFVVAWALSSFCNNVAGMLITWGFIYKICGLLDYKPFDKFSTLLVFGVGVMGALSLSALPWHGNALVILNSYMASSGDIINYAHYLAYSIPFGFFSILGYMALCKFVFKMDVSRLQNLDTNVFNAKDLELTASRKMALSGLAVLILGILIPNLMPQTSSVYAVSAKLGLSLKAVIVIIVLSLMRVEGKPVFQFGKLAAKGIPWGMVLMMMAIFCFVNLLGNPTAGISAFLGKVFTPMFQGVSPVVFFLLILVITIFLTNFMINMVVAVIMIAATVPVAATLGIGSQQVVYLITVACTIAFMLPPASAASCVLFANTEWVRAKDVYKYGAPTIVMMAAVALIWNIILFMF